MIHVKFSLATLGVRVRHVPDALTGALVPAMFKPLTGLNASFTLFVAPLVHIRYPGRGQGRLQSRMQIQTPSDRAATPLNPLGRAAGPLSHFHHFLTGLVRVLTAVGTRHNPRRPLDHNPTSRGRYGLSRS